MFAVKLWAVNDGDLADRTWVAEWELLALPWFGLILDDKTVGVDTFVWTWVLGRIGLRVTSSLSLPEIGGFWVLLIYFEFEIGCPGMVRPDDEIVCENYLELGSVLSEISDDSDDALVQAGSILNWLLALSLEADELASSFRTSEGPRAGIFCWVLDNECLGSGFPTSCFTFWLLPVVYSRMICATEWVALTELFREAAVVCTDETPFLLISML